MMIPRARWAPPRVYALLAALALGLGCGDATGPEDGPLDQADARVLAVWMTDVDASGGDDYGLASDARSGSHEFSRSAPCPAGGTHTVSGTGTRSLDDLGVLSTTWTATQTHDGCMVTHTRGDRRVTVVIDGSVSAVGAASWQVPLQREQPRRLLAFTNHRSGTTTTAVGDRSRTCEIDVTETYDASTGTFTIQGTICGRTVDVTRTPGERPRR